MKGVFTLAFQPSFNDFVLDGACKRSVDHLVVLRCQ